MNHRPSSTTIMHAMAFEGSPYLYLSRYRLERWWYGHISSAVMSAATTGISSPLNKRCKDIYRIGFHYSGVRCGYLTQHDWVECYGMRNGLPFVIHHKVGECKR